MPRATLVIAALAVVIHLVVLLVSLETIEAKPPLSPPTTEVGDPERGRSLIDAYGCGSCHRIPGVPGAVGRVGPVLVDLDERTLLAGRLPNTPANLVLWLRAPQEIAPGTAMPDLGLRPDEAGDIAAFLLAGERGPRP